MPIVLKVGREEEREGCLGDWVSFFLWGDGKKFFLFFFMGSKKIFFKNFGKLIRA